MDVSITTHLQSIHIPALLPPTSTELDVPHNVQVSAVLGIGLVFQDTGHRHDAEVCSLRSAQNHGLTEYYDQRLKNVPSVGVSGHQRGRHLSKSDPGYDLPEDQQQVYRRLAESSRHHVRPGLHSGSVQTCLISVYSGSVQTCLISVYSGSVQTCLISVYSGSVQTCLISVYSGSVQTCLISVYSGSVQTCLISVYSGSVQTCLSLSQTPGALRQWFPT
ncbi:uncharacterized protein LOC109888818 isoform X2 [Oncorhynchus kisutch]|nr:uncharacterized protein LOC109888818 isoform X2 [Oncorhynchus kisutch]